MRSYLSELREGTRILGSAPFWRDVRAYWSPDAVAARLNAWAERLR